MSKRIDFIVTDEFYEQMELICKLKSSNKSDWISGLIRTDMAIFFQNYKQEKMQEELDQKNRDLRKSWALDEVTNNNLINIGKSYVFPPAY